MRKKKNELLAIIKENIINNYKSYLIVLIIFAVGVFLGVMILNQTEKKEDIEKYINTYIDETKSIENGNYLIEVKNEIKNNIILVFLLWFAGTTIIGIPIVLGIILARGFCLGYTISACVYVLGKIKGLIFVIITLFLQNMIFIPALMVLGVSSIKLYTSIIKDRRKENIKISILRHSIVSIIIAIILILEAIINIEISYKLLVNLAKYF